MKKTQIDSNTQYEMLLVQELKSLKESVRPAVPNPAPLGLFAFGFTTCLLQLKHTRIGGDDPEDIEGVTAAVVGFAMFFGGFLQVVAGLTEIKRNNLFGYTAFLLFGGLWMSIGTIDVLEIMAHPESNFASPNPKAVTALLFLSGLFTTVLWICSFLLNKTLNLLFFLLATTLFLLSGGVYNATVDKIGGWFGIATSAVAYWLAAAELFNEILGEGTREVVPLGKFHWRRSSQVHQHHVEEVSDVEAPHE
ncbi:acetate transporter [Nitzschia inconspicua]|uniref:Acetate transporter n=1 Tax=Nitzschia inconspicua TaxID=303405 RepID=A0A9K3LWR6_9STRA|nr:acetate transporter [Nitzschia inconspicua]